MSAKDAAAQSSQSSQTQATSKGYALSTAIWSRVPIGVCWDMNNADFAQFAAQRDWTRSAVEETWESHSGARFTGWRQCANDPNYYGIRVRVEDNPAIGPHAFGLGSMLNNAVGGMTLNFTFKNWSPSCQGREEYCIRRVAAHEFGHALGFAHEQNRPDEPSACNEPPQGMSGNTMIGAWDLASIMNLCNLKWNGDGKLSATDIEMAQKFYGSPVLHGTVYTLTRAQAPAQVTAYDYASRTAKATIDLSLTGDYARVDQMFASADGKRLHILLERSATSMDLISIDTSTQSIARVTPISPLLAASTAYSLTPAPDSNLVYLSNKNIVTVIDTDSGSITKTIVLPAEFELLKVTTAADDSGNLYALSIEQGTKLEVLRIDLSLSLITGGYPAGAAPVGMQAQFAVTPDAKKAYFVGFASAQGAGSLTEMDLDSGITRVLSDLPAKKPAFLTAIGNDQILFVDANEGNSSPIVRYDVASRTRTNLLSSSTSVMYLQYDPATRSIFLDRNGVWSVNQLKERSDGKYRAVDLGLRSFTTGSVYGGVAPFVFVAR